MTRLTVCSSGTEGFGRSELITAASIERCRAELIGVAGADRSTPVAPGGPDIGDDGRDLVVREEPSERWHAIRLRIACCTWRIAAIEHHADRIDRGFHFYGLVAGERRPMRRLALTLRAVTACASRVIDGFAETHQQAAFGARQYPSNIPPWRVCPHRSDIAGCCGRLPPWDRTPRRASRFRSSGDRRCPSCSSRRAPLRGSRSAPARTSSALE